MQYTVDLRQSIPQVLGSPKPSYLWLSGPTEADDGQVAVLQAQPYSFMSECQCPDDCPRDHENE
jgi:hypothetical protein